MKVLHVTNLFPFKEAPTFGIFVKEQVDSLDDENLQDVFFINARRNGIKEYFRVINELRKVVGDYDIVHCHHQFSAISTYMAKNDARMITAVLGDIEKRNFLNKVVFSIAKRISQRIIVKNKLPSSSKKFILLPNGVNLELFKEKSKNQCRDLLGLSHDKVYVLFVCNGPLSNPIKRHDKFQEVVDSLNEKTPTETEYLPLYVSNVKREDVPTYFYAADFMLLTSDHEGSPNAIKEAMACNLPIVSTSVGDVPVLLKDVENSYVSTNGATEELTVLSLRLNLEKKSTGRHKLKALELDSHSVARKLKSLYSDLMNH